MPTPALLSVAQVCDIAPGTKENASWINGGFSGVVNQITQKSYGQAGKFMWPCVIGDVNGPQMIEMTLFKPPTFKEGDLIDVHGKGIRRTEFRGQPKVDVGKDTIIDVSGGRQPVNPAPAPRYAQSAGRNDTRGGGDSHPDLEASGKGANGFHPMMQSFSLLYLHALAYARKINTTLKADGHPVMSEGQFQACVSTLYINADRAGLSLNPPPLKVATVAKPAPAASRADADRLGDPDDSETIPF